jgi:hypothetical protein
VEKNMPKLAGDCINIIKNMKVTTAKGKALKAAYLALFQIESDLLNQNIRAV